MLLKAYNLDWATDFRRLEQQISAALSGLKIRIEHVGSTAVPGMAAKPIIDIDAVYFNNEFEEIKERLNQIGYYHNGNQGITDREVFKRNKTVVKDDLLDAMDHHLYVCPENSEEFKQHILFRNYLVANKEARDAYHELKYLLAKEANNDRRLYAALKEVRVTDFVNVLLRKRKGIRK